MANKDDSEVLKIQGRLTVNPGLVGLSTTHD